MKQIEFFSGCSDKLQPVCLLTYETAYSRQFIIQFDCDYKDINDLVTKHFGHEHMDNKITLVFRDTSKVISNPVYLTYWDGKVSIGLDVHYFADLLLKSNQYRKVFPK